MSGEANGLILIPLAVMAMPYIVGGLAVAGVAAIGLRAGAAALDYERRRRKQRKEIPHGVHQTMNEQTALNVKTSEQMMRELEEQRTSMLRTAQQNDAQAYQDYVASMKKARKKAMQKISDAQVKFNSLYRRKISQSMANLSQEFSAHYDSCMKELSELQNNLHAKDAKAKEIAKSYINEARELLKTFAEEFEAQKFSPRQLTSLNEQFNQTVKLFDSGRYESSIASAKDVALNTLEEMFEADASKQEWDNYMKLSLVLSEEVKTYLESNSTITQEAKEYAEKASGMTLEDEIVGINIADYTDRDAQGKTLFAKLTEKANEIYNELHSDKADNLTTEQLKTYANYLNNDLYPASVSCINKAIVNMNNAFSRQNISEELINFFEEHNFTFNGYAYDNDKHDEALHIGLENHATGEELIITLAPELINNGDIQTHIDLKQIKGDEANEERKAYYRECVEEVVKGSTPQARVNIKCNAATRNKLSQDTETRKKLRR